MKAADLNEGMDNTLLILNNRMQQRIAVNKDYGNLPLASLLLPSPNESSISEYS